MNTPLIHILPEHEARKIAAGEVVERPASVIKELLENALDAGATEIEVAIKDGGRSHMSIRDNGCGMSPEDAHLCIEHHATSKIKTIDELMHIVTFGFRGEALSSIASVSQLTVTTRRPQDIQGYQIIVHCGKILHSGPISAPVGTSIAVDNLFENVPARKKFLKQRDTEWRAIQQLVTAYALAYPQIGFQLQHESVVNFTAPQSATMLERAQQIFDREIGERLIAIDTTAGEYHIKGFVSDHQHTRYDRRAIFSFINNRWVKNYGLGKAIISGYQNVLPPAKYPCAALAITMPLNQVDINVHPRKEEVLLLHPTLVANAIEKAVSAALATRVARFTVAPQMFEQPQVFKSYASDELSFHKKSFSPAYATPAHTSGPSAAQWHAKPQQFFNSQSQPKQHSVSKNVFQSIDNDPFVQQELPVQTAEQHTINTALPIEIPAYDIVGQLHATYIMVETGEGLLILDQHAAHESVLYYQLQHHAHAEEPIKLLFVEYLSIAPEHRQYLPIILSELANIGVIAETEADHLVIQATTHHFKKVVLQDCVHSMLQILDENSGIESAAVLKKLRHTTYAMIACKAAVKAGDALSHDEMRSLVQLFLKTPERLTCPHGRPTSWMVSMRELEKKFQRV